MCSIASLTERFVSANTRGGNARHDGRHAFFSSRLDQNLWKVGPRFARCSSDTAIIREKLDGTYQRNDTKNRFRGRSHRETETKMIAQGCTENAPFARRAEARYFRKFCSICTHCLGPVSTLVAALRESTTKLSRTGRNRELDECYDLASSK